MVNQTASVEVRYGWVVIAASLALNTIALGAPSILFVTLKPIAAEFDAPRTVPSLAYSLLMLGAGVGGVLMGWWMDRRGIFQPVIFGSVMIGFGALVASQSSTPWSLYVANGLLMGLLGKAAMIAPLVANATRWFDRRRGLAVAIIASGQGLAGASWPPLTRLISDEVGWRETYLYFGIFALVTMLPLAWLIRPAPPTGRGAGGTSHSDGGVLTNGWSLGTTQVVLWIAVIGCCTAMSMPMVHLVSHATDLGHAKVRAAELLSVLFAAAFISRIGFGLLADRIGALPTLLIGSACQAVMLAVFAFVDSLAGLYVAALLFGLGFAGIMPCYPLVIRLVFPVREAGWRIAAQYMFGSLGMALGGWLGGYIFERTGGYTDAFLTGFAFNLMNFVLILALYASLHRRPMTPAPA
ncbi:MAG: MFS transporter [Pseudomonadota bacterium]